MVTLEEAKHRWRTYTAEVVTRPFGRAKWSVNEEGVPMVTGDVYTLQFKRDKNGRVYAESNDYDAWRKLYK